MTWRLVGVAVCKLNARMCARVPSAAPSSPRGSSLVSCPVFPTGRIRTVGKHQSDLAGFATLLSATWTGGVSFSVAVITKYTPREAENSTGIV